MMQSLALPVQCQAVSSSKILGVCVFYPEYITQTAEPTHAALVVGKRWSLLSWTLRTLNWRVHSEKNVACGFSQCDVCYCLEGPVMVFQGLFKTTCPTTEVSKSNARYRNVALSLANIQSIVVCFELSLPSSCPVNLHFCLWFPLWLHRAPSRLACSWNHRRFLWVTRLMTWN